MDRGGEEEGLDGSEHNVHQRERGIIRSGDDDTWGEERAERKWFLAVLDVSL